MKKFSLLVLVLATFVGSLAAKAEPTYHMRLLFHGHRAIGEEGWGVASWVLAPDIVSKPDKWLGVVGPRYDGTGWYVEGMFGTVMQGGAGKFMFDLRWELNPKLWDIPLLIWNNEQVFGLSFEDWIVYSYLRVVYVLPKGLGLIGVETEDLNFKNKPDNYSVGVHIIIPIVGPLVIIPAYQWHFVPGQGYTGDEFWIRMVLDFK
ncbi:MAG: hypothetical protein US42_C0008G0024 [Candidatus Magasanikbacteria bacterium GW2011_GWC2_37_14]|uniref:Uncharacterized protein n=1 Tax=Candidatus Magasanikbacteria bacterium GW2011_GWC2_37_14 TaxID=1619046 RepID=A0A0G0G8T5_9BACT|nr:MAG: hypothetical protein US42_C0008G0024 [Candidatus Magasanikbacteria bacterium GW2011_GWC2_37_14]